MQANMCPPCENFISEQPLIGWDLNDTIDFEITLHIWILSDIATTKCKPDGWKATARHSSGKNVYISKVCWL